MGTLVRALGVIAVFTFVPLVGVWWLVGQPDQLSPVTDPVMPIVGTPHEIVDDGLIRVELAPAWSSPEVVYTEHPAFGTVTRVVAEPESAIGIGDVILSVDRVDRIAWIGETPFHRPLRVRDTGSDVVDLHILLVTLGYLEGELGDTFTSATRDAVRGLESDLGVGKPVGVFDPGWIVRIPSDSFDVGEVHVRVGGAAPQPGGAILSGAARVTQVQVFDLATRSSPVLDEGRWILTIDDAEFVIDNREVISQVAILDYLTAVSEPGDEPVRGELRRESPRATLSLPIGAVQSGASGTTCVWSVLDSGYSPVPVSVEAPGPGYVIVADIGASDEILLNPSAVLTDLTCP
ncbi:MAG: hypothetical protein ABFR89_12255 [Actinomycetota bacterium]